MTLVDKRMSQPHPLAPEEIALRIFVLRGQRVLLDSDLAQIYGVPTKRLNEQVKRNARRFPEDFVFQLTRDEAQALIQSRHQPLEPETVRRNWSQIATGRQKHRDPRALPYAFTEHRAIQAANVLSSEAAIEMGVHVVRAFIRLRQLLVTHKTLARKLDEIEAKVGAHDEQLAAIIEALRQLTALDAPEHSRRIGFHQS